MAALPGPVSGPQPVAADLPDRGPRGELILGIDGMESRRHRLTPTDEATFRVGDPEWSPERVRFDTLIEGRAQRATLSGMPYYRAFTA